MIRTFIAAEINEEVKQALVSDLKQLKNAAPRVKWVKPESLHLTFKFLGDVEENDLAELFAAIGEAAAVFTPFAVAVAEIGAFPNWKTPRVVWAGCEDGSEELQEVFAAVENACYSLGYPEEAKPYNPHLTLGRIKLPADSQGLLPAVEKLGKREYGYIDIDEIIVFMSDLCRGGPVYAPMFRAKLKRSKHLK